jgi:pyruvate-ferredoxin/flavodoxin oxidoreductase
VSHEKQKIEELDDSIYKKMFSESDYKKYKSYCLSPVTPTLRGSAQNSDYFFQNTLVRKSVYAEVYDKLEELFEKFNHLTGRSYKPFELIGRSSDTNLIICMGSACDTIEEVIKDESFNTSLLKIRLFSPFFKDKLSKILTENYKKISVLDRYNSFSSSGQPLYNEILNCVNDKNKLLSGVYGIGGKEFNIENVKSIIANMNNEQSLINFTINVDDDINFSSLPEYEELEKNNNETNIKILGIGGDGTYSLSN